MTVPSGRSMGAAGSRTSTQAQGNCGAPTYPLVLAAVLAGRCHSGGGKRPAGNSALQKGRGEA